MTRTVYVNGRYRPYAEASVHVEDRGFQFADAVYEVIEVMDGQFVDAPRHLARLDRSLNELRIPRPMSEKALLGVMAQTIRRNRVRNGLLYLQVSRGAARRDFALPPDGTRPTLVCLARSLAPGVQAATAEKGIAVKTVPDIRWRRCDIKTVMLLPAVLAKAEAHEEGAKEAWLVDADGFVTEGAASNAWIVDAQGRLVTRGIGPSILAGVTRATVLDALAREGLNIEQRAFTVAEAKRAREAFITSATNTVMPVVAVDGTPIGDGRPGPVARRLRAVFHDVAEGGAAACPLRRND
ncbi:MAG: D-amino-acid transaminase [Hyphomicrobiaceae bacterium]